MREGPNHNCDTNPSCMLVLLPLGKETDQPFWAFFYWSKLTTKKHEGFSPCFHLPRLHVRHLFLTHTHTDCCCENPHSIIQPPGRARSRLPQSRGSRCRPSAGPAGGRPTERRNVCVRAYVYLYLFLYKYIYIYVYTYAYLTRGVRACCACCLRCSVCVCVCVDTGGCGCGGVSVFLCSTLACAKLIVPFAGLHEGNPPHWSMGAPNYISLVA